MRWRASPPLSSSSEHFSISVGRALTSIRAVRRWWQHARSADTLPSALGPDAKPLLAIEAGNPFVVDPPALALQQDGQPPVTGAHLGGRQITTPQLQDRL